MRTHPFLWMALGMGLVLGPLPDRVEAVDQPEPPDQNREVEPQRKQMIQQLARHWEQSLTWLMRRELNLIRATCGDLSVDARREIIKAGEAAVKQSAIQMAQLQLGESRRSVDPGVAVTKALDKAVAQYASPESLAAYRREAELRDHRQRLAVVRQIVLTLDLELYLTEAQRQAITGSLMERWQPAMMGLIHQVQFNERGQRIFFGVPPEAVRPHLTESQQARFHTQDHQNQHKRDWQIEWMWVNLNKSIQIEADPWWKGS